MVETEPKTAFRVLKDFSSDEEKTLISKRDWAGITGLALVVGVIGLMGFSSATGKDVPQLEYLAGFVSSIVSFYFGRKL